MIGDQWYFAYGSNLFVDQKEERTGYLDKIVSGARHHGLPEAYIELIEALASG